VCLYQRHYPLEDAARCLGFNSQASFRKFFKAHFGDYPRAYQKATKDLLEQV
jgi:transcriptional regulator GlxA family with amidase domain